MNLNTSLDNITVVALSRRNIEGLLAQLDEAKKGDPAQIMRRTGDHLFIIIAEENDAHYNSEARDENARGRAGSSGPGQAYGEEIPA